MHKRNKELFDKITEELIKLGAITSNSISISDIYDYLEHGAYHEVEADFTGYSIYNWYIDILLKSGVSFQELLKSETYISILWFDLKMKYLKKIVIESNIEIINSDCFGEFDSIESVVFNSPFIVSVPSGFCRDCSNLKTIELGRYVNSIHKYAFSRADALETLFFPRNIKYIESNAFANCFNLKKIEFEHTDNDMISDKINWSEVFYRCDNLGTIIVHNTKLYDKLTEYFKELKRIKIVLK